MQEYLEQKTEKIFKKSNFIRESDKRGEILKPFDQSKSAMKEEKLRQFSE